MGNSSNQTMRAATEKLKIVWICHFLNQSLKKQLSIPEQEKEFAPWISLGIDEFRKREDMELHVIAPFYTLLTNRSFREANIYFHCIKVGVPFRRRRWPAWFNLESFFRYGFFNNQVKRLINRIKPDIVNLYGTENAYYSSSVLRLKNYPVLVTIQGFVTLNNMDKIKNPEVRRRIKVEEELLREMKYFGVEATSIEKQIRKYNPEAKMYWSHFPFTKTEVTGKPEKEYDLVFFAKIVKMKGIEDLIYAVSKVRGEVPDVKLQIIGRGDEAYLSFLRQLIDDLGLQMNISFRGFIATQQEMHYEVMKARISVLPTYNDTIPGTIIESMLLGLPVISYATGGIPDLNRTDENVILVDTGDKDRLASEIIRLLKDPQRQSELGATARKFAEKEFDNANSADMLVQAYKEVIMDYSHRVPES